MGAPAPQPPGPHVADLERELARHARGVSAGEVVFDLLFGVLAPFGVVWGDPALFTSEFGQQAAFPAYYAPLAQVVTICLAASLALWLVTGARRSWLGVLVAGPFAIGALLSVVVGVKLVWAALGFGLHFKGLMGLAPWLMAFVLARQGLRAIRAAADVSAALAAVSLVVGAVVLLGTLGIASKTLQRRARLLEDQLFSKSIEDHRFALAQMLGKKMVDVDAIVVRYADLRRRDSRRARIAAAYLSLTGESIDIGFQRLGIRPEDEEAQEGETRRPGAPPSTAAPAASTRTAP